MVREYDLIIFDLDGTLVKSWTAELLPGVAEYFQRSDLPKLAVATNQGGVGLRYWMERDGFGEPKKYPTRTEVLERMKVLKHRVFCSVRTQFFVSWAYQSKKGTWSPTPPCSITGMWEIPGILSSWDRSWRKPNPDMLVIAMEWAIIEPERTLMVGDMESDYAASTAARCDFMHADKFFGRS